MISGIQKIWQRFVFHATSYDGLSTSSHLLNWEAINQQSTHGDDHFISHFPFYSVLVIIIYFRLLISYHPPINVALDALFSMYITIQSIWLFVPLKTNSSVLLKQCRCKYVIGLAISWFKLIETYNFVSFCAFCLAWIGRFLKAYSWWFQSFFTATNEVVVIF